MPPSHDELPAGLPDDARLSLEAAISSRGPVAFDADGTLWRGDVGEELLRWLAHEDRLPTLKGRSGVFAEYERRVAVDPADAYAWSVEVMRELEEAELNAICQRVVADRFAGRFFRPIVQLVRALQGAGCPVWIVSASPWWPVVAGARLLEIPPERVIGVSCPVREGRLTGEVDRPVVCGDGKVQSLEARDVRPVLAVGNGELDIPMLAYAERAIAVAPHEERNALTTEAKRRGWPILRC